MPAPTTVAAVSNTLHNNDNSQIAPLTVEQAAHLHQLAECIGRNHQLLRSYRTVHNANIERVLAQRATESVGPSGSVAATFVKRLCAHNRS